ncbi:unnamed protein product [Symbiodinium sp. CCMP2592]|nr:unnamed protein product [Symbiodinium sp. CCMP2592]
MRFYVSGKWGFSLLWGYYGSVLPLAVVMALPNAAIAFTLATLHELDVYEQDMCVDVLQDQDTINTAWGILSIFSTCMFFVLNFRSQIAYNRWWEGGTLLQQTRGEWFNCFSSLVAFTNPAPELACKVEEFQHLLVRLMSLLFCCALQQVSPDRDRPFEVLSPAGIDPASLSMLSKSKDKVEVILQWLQRLITLSMQDSIIVVAPPVVTRAYQELSRGIVNLQNARKIAEFPFPFPLAQVSMAMLCLHWALVPVLCSMLLGRVLAACVSFIVICFLWAQNFIALQLESPFGCEPNDLPMHQMQGDWKLGTRVYALCARLTCVRTGFCFDPELHYQFSVVMSNIAIPNKRRAT